MKYIFFRFHSFQAREHVAESVSQGWGDEVGNDIREYKVGEWHIFGGPQFMIDSISSAIDETQADRMEWSSAAQKRFFKTGTPLTARDRKRDVR